MRPSPVSTETKVLSIHYSASPEKGEKRWYRWILQKMPVNVSSIVTDAADTVSIESKSMGIDNAVRLHDALAVTQS